LDTANKEFDYVSPERIYQYIWTDKKQGGELYLHLRRKGRKYRKRGNKKDTRGIIKNRIGIEQRPKIVDKKKRFGDLETDTIIGKNHKGAIVTINDRASGFLWMEKVKNRTAEAVKKATISLLKTEKDLIKTITADNGKEFALHEEIAKDLMLNFYFARPYHSWERGANEKLNLILILPNSIKQL
jgi:transposase, IS30 family